MLFIYIIILAVRGLEEIRSKYKYIAFYSIVFILEDLVKILRTRACFVFK
jgi:hypothetical protein